MHLSPRFPRRLLAALVPLPVLAALAFPGVARAQTASDADRAAARQLFVDGVKLQEAGNFADALDRFERAQAVFSAPTHLLHIAECDAALGKLVESAETYRTLVRTPLPAGAPNAFVQAQQQASAELTQVEPRIPSIRLFVKPPNLQGLNIQIDGQAMSAALVGVQRPTDPGTHVVSVSAPGYMRSEQKVILREKENKDVTANLPTAGGIMYAPPPATAPVQTSHPPPTLPRSQSPPPPPPMYGAPPEDTAHKPANGGFMLGVTAGGQVPAGNLRPGDAGQQRRRARTGYRPPGRLSLREAPLSRGRVRARLPHERQRDLGCRAQQRRSGDALTASASSRELHRARLHLHLQSRTGWVSSARVGAGYRVLSLDLNNGAGSTSVHLAVRRRDLAAGRGYPHQDRRLGPPRPEGVGLGRLVLEHRLHQHRLRLVLRRTARSPTRIPIRSCSSA